MINKYLKTSISTCNNNNSLHKLGFKVYMQAGEQKLRYDLEWPM